VQQFQQQHRRLYPPIGAGGGNNKKSVMTRSDDFIQTYRPTVQSGSEFGDEIQTDDDELKLRYQQNNIGVSPRRQTNSSVTARPPLSPTKIPSPMHSSLRVRGTSVNRSFRSSYSVSICIVHLYPLSIYLCRSFTIL
jgi:hypothetical protein